MAFVAFLIVLTFALATITSSGPASYLNLLIAMLGYNAGLINFLVGFLIIRRLRSDQSPVRNTR
jgi:NhaP-type Na+/H+ or K+/H+ antiporter